MPRHFSVNAIQCRRWVKKSGWRVDKEGYIIEQVLLLFQSTYGGGGGWAICSKERSKELRQFTI